MKKVGFTVINKSREGGRPAKCINCGGKGIYRVTFKDTWGKLTISLCDACSRKQYGELRLQRSLDESGGS